MAYSFCHYIVLRKSTWLQRVPLFRLTDLSEVVIQVEGSCSLQALIDHIKSEVLLKDFYLRGGTTI